MLACVVVIDRSEADHATLEVADENLSAAKQFARVKPNSSDAGSFGSITVCEVQHRCR